MKNHIVGIGIILGISIFISIGCIVIIYRNFKKSKLNESKNFKKDIKLAFSNSFVSSSLFSIITACIIYGFLENILETLKLSNSIIAYCIFAAKIWFVSSPFIGLEFAVLYYFISIGYFKKSIIIVNLKVLSYILICLLYYQSRKWNCLIYAKPVCDTIFLVYYSRICFDITFNKC